MSKIRISDARWVGRRSKALDRGDMETYDLYGIYAQQEEEQLKDPEWAKNNMEYDLRTTDWIIAKAEASEAYAQNLYAAMCNNDFQKMPEDTPEGVVQVLSDSLPVWSCSWRHAGGVIADMLERGDYMEWYCSGILHDGPENGEEPLPLTPEQLARLEISKHFVGEGVVTDEIRADLLRLGWRVIEHK
jgi:hypothetical protein